MKTRILFSWTLTARLWSLKQSVQKYKIVANFSTFYVTRMNGGCLGPVGRQGRIVDYRPGKRALASWSFKVYDFDYSFFQLF